jgi:hypothetical protein
MSYATIEEIKQFLASSTEASSINMYRVEYVAEGSLKNKTHTNYISATSPLDLASSIITQIDQMCDYAEIVANDENCSHRKQDFFTFMVVNVDEDDNEYCVRKYKRIPLSEQFTKIHHLWVIGRINIEPVIEDIPNFL